MRTADYQLYYNMATTCKCKWCTKFSPLCTKISELLNEEDKETFDELIGLYITAEEDSVYWKDKFYGTWPSDTVESIQRHIERLQVRIQELEQQHLDKEYANSLRGAQ